MAGVSEMNCRNTFFSGVAFLFGLMRGRVRQGVRLVLFGIRWLCMLLVVIVMAYCVFLISNALNRVSSAMAQSSRRPCAFDSPQLLECTVHDIGQGVLPQWTTSAKESFHMLYGERSFVFLLRPFHVLGQLLLVEDTRGVRMQQVARQLFKALHGVIQVSEGPPV